MWFTGFKNNDRQNFKSFARFLYFFGSTIAVVFFFTGTGCKPNEALRTSSQYIVTDTSTDLMWQRTVSEAKYAWMEARGYCDKLELGGYSDWMVPNRDQLESIIAFGRRPSIDSMAFPGTPNEWFWTSSPIASTSYYSWAVHFGFGVTISKDISNDYRIRCVRTLP